MLNNSIEKFSRVNSKQSSFNLTLGIWNIYSRGNLHDFDLIETCCYFQTESFSMEKDAIELFEKATKHGIRRTVHAGESGGAEQVTNAVDILHAERIGHGYRIVSDQKIYNRIKDEKIHLECCPWSSLLTGSISVSEHPHPIVKYADLSFCKPRNVKLLIY